jgi:hypothetical protein
VARSLILSLPVPDFWSVAAVGSYVWAVRALLLSFLMSGSHCYPFQQEGAQGRFISPFGGDECLGLFEELEGVLLFGWHRAWLDFGRIAGTRP